MASVPNNEDLAGRLVLLERNLSELQREVGNAQLQSRRRRHLVVFVIVGGFLSFLVGRSIKTVSPSVVNAERFELHDKDGNVLGVLQSSTSKALFTFYDNEDKSMFHIQASNDGSTGIQIYDPTGKPRLVIGNHQSGEVGVSILDTGGRKRIILGIDKSGEPGLAIYDSEGTPLVQLPN